jgi:hypothetical protein
MVGLVMSTCSFTGYASAIQFDHPGNRPVFAVFGVMGLILLIFPVVNFINAEVRLADGFVSKRGTLRLVRRWPASNFVRIDAHSQTMLEDRLDYIVYRFHLKNQGVAFALSLAWWRATDVEMLARALYLPMPRPQP